MSPASHDKALSRAFDGAVADHFGGPKAMVDAEEVTVAGCALVGKHIAGVRDPVSRGVLLAQAQWTLRRIVAELTRRDAAKGAGRHGTT